MSDEDSKGMKPIAFVLGADPEKRIVILQFSGKVDRVEFTPDQALIFAEQIMSRCLIARGGKLPEPDISVGLPLLPREHRDKR